MTLTDEDFERINAALQGMDNDTLLSHEADKAIYLAGMRAGMERAAQRVENGRFLHDDAPTARFAKECAAAIRALK